MSLEKIPWEKAHLHDLLDCDAYRTGDSRAMVVLKGQLLRLVSLGGEKISIRCPLLPTVS